MNCSKCSSVSALVYILISIFAISSWVDIIGLWVELPLIINQLPEQWNLPSYMALVIQLSNAAPALYSFITKVISVKRKSLEKNYSHKNRDVFLSFGIIIIEALSILLMSFFWNKTVWINGKERSVALLFLLSLCAFCSCLSSLVYLPYMARYPAAYLSAYYIGQGLAGLLPGITGLIQGLGGEPTCINVTVFHNTTCNNTNCSDAFMVTDSIPLYPEPQFSIEVFLVIICSILFFSFLAFYILNYSRLKKHQIIAHSDSVSMLKKCMQKGQNIDLNYDIQKPVTENEGGDDLPNRQLKGRFFRDTLSINFAFYLILIALINASTNGILPATQSFTCLPYGNVVYTLSIRLSSVVGPMASLSTMFLPKPGGKLLAGLTILGLGIVVYHQVLAFQSPQPILQHNLAGPIIVVVSTLLMSACFSFVRVSAASLLHSCGGRRALIWCGAITQVGSFCGAMLAFILINHTSFFKSFKHCSNNID